MDGARIRTASRRVTSRAERRTILRGRLLGMQTSYRARILANPRFFVHRLSRLAVSIPLFPIHVSNCRPVSLTLAPLTSSLSRFLASSSEFASLPPVFQPRRLSSPRNPRCICIRARVLGVSDERTRYTRCLPFTILARRTTRSHLFLPPPPLPRSVSFSSSFFLTLLGHLPPMRPDPIFVMLSPFETRFSFLP